MTHIVTDACVKCKYTDCAVVCPVDCFYEGDHMLVINPEECIDCGVCIPECPIDAIKADIDITNLKEQSTWVTRNHKFSKIWPRITIKKPPPIDAESYINETNKFEKYIENNSR
jgi:ferredoxin